MNSKKKLNYIRNLHKYITRKFSWWLTQYFTLSICDTSRRLPEGLQTLLKDKN